MAPDGRHDGDLEARAPEQVLGYLVKHAHLLLETATDAALRPLEVTSRDLGVLRVIAADDRMSQQEIAARIGIDRTSMVALVDGLQRKGLVGREPSEQDRRRNIVTLTDAGRALFVQAELVVVETEQTVLAVLSEEEASTFRRALSVIVRGG